MDIAALLSGGVDSSVVVHLLCEQGYKPTLFYIKIGMDGAEYMDCSAEEDIELATATARRYGLPLEIVDLHREYWDNVAAYAIDKIRKGQTPNPDVMCNKLIKFGCFEQRVGKDFDFTATGHYATTLLRDRKIWLGTAKDPVKDQTDFLAQIDYLQVSKLMFPIGHLMKHEVREIAQNAKLPNARRKDSQGICFLGKINYNDFVRRFLGEKEGAVVEWETGKRIGTHRGYWFHTIGQRKGLGIAYEYPLYVIDKDIASNTVILGPNDALFQKALLAENCNLIAIDKLEAPLRVTAKTRYRQKDVPAVIEPLADGKIKVTFDEPQRAITPGQAVIFYYVDKVVGLGIIAAPLKE